MDEGDQARLPQADAGNSDGLTDFDGDPVPDSPPLLEERPEPPPDPGTPDSDPLGVNTRVLGTRWGHVGGGTPRADRNRAWFWIVGAGIGTIAMLPVLAVFALLAVGAPNWGVRLIALAACVLIGTFEYVSITYVSKGIRLLVRISRRGRG